MEKFPGKNKFKLAEKGEVAKYLFLLALSLLVFVDYISATSIPHPFTGRLFQVTIILLGIKILMTQYTKCEWAILGIGGVLAVASYFCTDSYYVCLLIMLIMASKDMALRPIMLVYFTIVSGITLLVMVLAASGICGNMYMEQDFRLNGLEIRYCMGYTHPNAFHIVLIQLFFCGDLVILEQDEMVLFCVPFWAEYGGILLHGFTYQYDIGKCYAGRIYIA